MRLRVALSALTMAEYFRDVQRQDVLLFIDNIFRFTQAGSEVSTLLGRMPSAVGYQPTLAGEMGAAPGADHLAEGPVDHLAAGDLRACGRHHRPGAAHCVRPPRRHHGAVAAADRTRASTRRWTRSTRRAACSTRRRSGGALQRWPPRCSRSCSATRTCRTSSPSSVIDELSEEDKLIVGRARRMQRFLAQPMFVAEAVHRPGRHLHLR